VTDLAERRIVVTGSAGVIGRELLERLSGIRSSVLSIDRLPLVNPSLPGIVHVQADLADAPLADIEAFRPEVVFHLAATFERSVEGPEFWDPNWRDNVIVSHRLAELAGRVGTEVFVFASSYLVYRPDMYLRPDADGDIASLREDDPLEPRNLCGAAKLYAEHEVAFQRLVSAAPLRTVSARIYRVYGRGSRDVISRWVRAGIEGQPIDVYHAQNRFDYVYAGDVAEGLLRLAGEPAAEGAVNLATGESRSISEVLEVLDRSLPGGLPTVRHLENDEPFEASAARVTRLEELTAWRPPTTIEAGIPRLVEYELRDAGR
jgi:carbamoyl-phosphate synthase large subunit